MTEPDPFDQLYALECVEGLQLLIRDKLLSRVGGHAGGCAEDVIRLMRAMGFFPQLPWSPTPIRSCADLDEGLSR